jgi:hypothetical protein
VYVSIFRAIKLRFYDFSLNVFYDGELFLSQTITAKTAVHLHRLQGTDTFDRHPSYFIVLQSVILLRHTEERTLAYVI